MVRARAAAILDGHALQVAAALHADAAALPAGTSLPSWQHRCSIGAAAQAAACLRP